MFQNINDEVIENNDEIDSNKVSKRFIDFKSFFSIPNIVLYAISLMASMVGFGKEFAPFAIAIFAATCSNKIPAGIMFLVTCIGSLIGFGVNGFLSYFITALLFIVLILIFKPIYQGDERNEKQKLGKFVLISSFIVQAGKMLFGMFLVYDLLTSIMISILSYIFYKIFVNSITVINEFEIHKAFTVEEVMGASMLISIAFYSFNGLSFFGLSISNILSIMLVLFLGWKNGVLVGATSGITIGIVLRNNWKFKSSFNSIICNITE